MELTIDQARELVANTSLWPAVRAHLAAGGEMGDFLTPGLGRLALVDEATRDAIARWLDALAHVKEWRAIVDGARVREIKAAYPGVWPEVFRLAPYFTRWHLETTVAADVPDACRMLLLKLKFPEVYALCCS